MTARWSLAGLVDRTVLGIVERGLRIGRLVADLPDGRTVVARGQEEGPNARVTIHDTRVLRRVAAAGGNGLADAYIEGEFDTDDLIELLSMASLSMETEYHVHLPARLEDALRVAWRTLGRSSQTRGPLVDIVHHYDLGNDFYAQWLDPTMTYSSAVFADEAMTLEEAQREKYRRLAEVADVREGMEVLEIGSGWGGFALHAAELGARVTTVTVSKEQATYVGKLAAERGLTDRIEVRLHDFAEIDGAYDRVASIEMMESIPPSRWPEFFRTIRSRLRPKGRAGLQLITVADRHWASSNANPDFVRRYIFPGGQVPSPSVLRSLAAEHGFAWVTNREYGRSYARTLATWMANFDAAWPRIAELGFDEPFRRMWRYYLAYCSAGFGTDRTDVTQFALEPA
jgi:cyclopropane-fatty-acyl-phospholipid synthase